MKNLAIIPARGGSTRLKNKNITPLLGQPLIRWITKSVIATGLFNEVIISTDSDKIYETVKDLQVVYHKRSKLLATTKSTVLETILSILDDTKEKFDTIGYFLPTCPFIKADSIAKGLKVLSRNDVDTVVSITEYTETVQLACKFNDGKLLPQFNNLQEGNTNSKYLDKYYRPTGGFYIGKWDRIKLNRNFFIGNVYGVNLSYEESIDINYEEDIKLAESIHRNQK